MKSIKVNRKITSKSIQIKELEKFIGKDVEITIQEKEAFSDNKTADSAAGMLQEFGKISSKQIDEKNAWKNAVKDKHGTG